MNLLSEYKRWRDRQAGGWGLAWYLAAELCQRFYRSHGVARPHRWFGRVLFPLYHPGRRGRLSRSEGQQLDDWRALRDVLPDS